MRVAVVTPYFDETIAVLSQCHESVRAQAHAGTHFLISDGSPRAAEIAGWTARHVSLGAPHRDGGSTPRGIGSLLAMSEQFDAIAYLDADNWYEPLHLEKMVKLAHETGAEICTAARSLHRTDGSFMYEDRLESDGKRHVDTSCLFLTRPAFGLLPLWTMMPRELGPRCDQVFWLAIQAQKFRCSHSPEATVAYRTRYDIHYQNMREPPPADVKRVADFLQVGAWWASLPTDAKDRWHRYFTTRIL